MINRKEINQIKLREYCGNIDYFSKEYNFIPNVIKYKLSSNLYNLDIKFVIIVI